MQSLNAAEDGVLPSVYLKLVVLVDGWLKPRHVSRLPSQQSQAELASSARRTPKRARSLSPGSCRARLPAGQHSREQSASVSQPNLQHQAEQTDPLAPVTPSASAAHDDSPIPVAWDFEKVPANPAQDIGASCPLIADLLDELWQLPDQPLATAADEDHLNVAAMHRDWDEAIAVSLTQGAQPLMPSITAQPQLEAQSNPVAAAPASQPDSQQLSESRQTIADMHSDWDAAIAVPPATGQPQSRQPSQHEQRRALTDRVLDMWNASSEPRATASAGVSQQQLEHDLQPNEGPCRWDWISPTNMQAFGITDLLGGAYSASPQIAVSAPSSSWGF